VTDRESNPRPVGASSGDSTTHLKRSAVISGTEIHRLMYRDICVERGASYAACAAHNKVSRGYTYHHRLTHPTTFFLVQAGGSSCPAATK